MTPCVLFEDEHLLVVDKPAGLNTHAPSPYAGEGLYDWLRHREPRWAALAIIHRLDKETSGVLVFGKTPLANKSLTEQFTQREVHKKYILLTDRPVNQTEFTVKSEIAWAGEKYVGRSGGDPAETHFYVEAARPHKAPAPHPSLRATPSPSDGERAGRGAGPRFTLVAAEPRTGRTHQIRVHAAEAGFPILGDTLYGGTAAERVFLHAAELHLRHPETGAACEFKSATGFASAGGGSQGLEVARRLALIDAADTNAFRLIHGASDGWPGWYIERLGDYLLSQAGPPLTTAQTTALGGLLELTGTCGAYHKTLNRQIRRTSAAEASPQRVVGDAAPERFEIRENGVRFELSFAEGYSVGLFLDQRDNRRRFLTGHIAAGFACPDAKHEARNTELLNCFAYTCGFSVCAAMAGARVTSLDLSKKYLEWGRRNFTLNGLDPAQHDFIYGDTFDWLRRLAKKQRTFDVVVLDPPTFSQSKESGVFRAEKDYGRLVTAALTVLKPGGVLLASTNAAEWPPEEFVAVVKDTIIGAGRRVTREHFVPQPPDFPITRAEPGYLKTFWVRTG